MEKGLVSVITPCYNTGLYIHRLLDSILIQTYPSIEVFVIDDGSTDNSRDVILEYIPKFKARNTRLEYVYQQNSGQSVAINNGLKMINGEYLLWPDSDDYYASEEAISQMVSALEKSSPDFAMVRTQEQIVEDDTFKTIGYNGLDIKEEEDASLFYDCLFQRNGYYFCPGAYMVRVAALAETTNLAIFTAKDAGQNWQLMLPILYKYRCVSIREVLYSVVERRTSHSRGQYQGYERSLQKFAVYEQTILETLYRINEMSSEERLGLIKEIKSKYKALRLLIHFNNANVKNFRTEYKAGDKLSGKDSFKAKCLSLCCHTPMVHSRYYRKFVLLSIYFLSKFSFVNS